MKKYEFRICSRTFLRSFPHHFLCKFKEKPRGPWPRAAGPFPGGFLRCGRRRRRVSPLPWLQGLIGYAKVRCLAGCACDRTPLGPTRPLRHCFRRPPCPPGSGLICPSYGQEIASSAGPGWRSQGGGQRGLNGCSIGTSRVLARQNALNRAGSAVRLNSHLGPAIPASLLMRWEPHDPIYLRNRRGGFLAG